jgi:hypothetical protein
MVRIMNTVKVLLMAGLLVSGSLSAQAQAPSSIRVRGTITRLAGTEMQVKTREGNEVTVSITPGTRISVLYPRKLSDIKQNSFVGVTAIPKAPGSPLVALEIHLFAEDQRGTGEGHYDWDLEPGSSMTNANVDAIVKHKNGNELTLGYKDGSQKIVVPPGIPVIAFKTADRSVLKIGEQIFCIAQKAANDSLTALHVSVGENGMKPPM